MGKIVDGKSLDHAELVGMVENRPAIFSVSYPEEGIDDWRLLCKHADKEYLTIVELGRITFIEILRIVRRHASGHGLEEYDPPVILM